MKEIAVLCPTCQQKSSLAPTNAYRPFCSDRCKLIDLGAWAKEEYKIPVENSGPQLWDDQQPQAEDLH